VYFFSVSIYDKQDSVRIFIKGFVLFVCAEFPVYPIYDPWSNIEHAQGFFLTNKEKKAYDMDNRFRDWRPWEWKEGVERVGR